MSEKIQILNAYDETTTEAKSDSYPYGRLRCQAKWWIEDNGKKGHRVCFQTINPKNGRVNAPKKGTYNAVCVLFINPENGHIEHDAVHGYCDINKVREFKDKYNLREKDDKFLAAWIAAKEKLDARRVEVKWTIETKEPVNIFNL